VKIDSVIGQMRAFSDLPLGGLFSTALQGEQIVGMKVVLASQQAVLAFTHSPHPEYQPPMIFEVGLFANRDVLWRETAVIRLPADPALINYDTSPSLHKPGAVIVTAQGTFIRAYHQSGLVDVNLENGACEPSRNHPGAIWLNGWQIVLLRTEDDVVLCDDKGPKAVAG
jgi:hypothetical protein